MQTPAGPVTAAGDSIGEAQRALDELLVIERAVEVTRERAQPSMISGRPRIVVYPGACERPDRADPEPESDPRRNVGSAGP